MTDDWTRVNNILAEVLELPETKRTAFVSEACIGANKQPLAPIRDNGFDNLLPTLSVAPGDSDRRSLACEALRSGTADPGGSSGYQSYLSFQPHILALLI